MGNLQTVEGGKSAGKSGQKSGNRSKMRLLGGKKGAKEEWTSVVPEDAKVHIRLNPEKEASPKLPDTTEVCRTTSSDSHFTLALSPAAFNQDRIISSENERTNSVPASVPADDDIMPVTLKPDEKQENGYFNEVFQPLNSFKLNEYRARVDQEKVTKLSKLGVSKTSQISLEQDGTGFSSGVVEITETEKTELDNDGDDDDEDQLDETVFYDKDDKENIKKLQNNNAAHTYRRHMSVPLDVNTLSDNYNSLQKAPSLSRSELESRLQRPKFVPEKLDFKLYEKFEGHMLVNWYLSELSSDSPARSQLGVAELKLLAAQFCTHLLAAGVLKQLPDPGVPPTNIFRPDCIYYWSHAEIPQSQPQTPGRLSAIYWPPSSPCDIISSPSDVTDRSAPLVLQEMKNSARDVEILSLEDEIKSLKQEVEKYKTLIEIQNLTASAVKDFGSPIEESKICEAINDTVVKKNTINASTWMSIQYIDKGVQAVPETNQRDVEIQTNEIPSATSRGIQTDPQKDAAVVESQASPIRIPSADSVAVPPPPPPLPPCNTRGPIPPPMPSGGVSVPPPPPLHSLTGPSPSIGGIPPPPPPPGIEVTPPPPPPPFPGIGVPPPPPPPGIGVPPPPPPPGIGVPPPPPPPCGVPGDMQPPPPPPPGGPMPMPAPPPGGFSLQKAGTQIAPLRLAIRKPQINPPVPMKPLYWTRILIAQSAVPQDGPALWDEIEELPLDKLSADFTKLFSRQVINRAPTVKKQEQKPKVEVVKLLDSKRSQNVGILAQSLRQDFQEIENAIYSFDTSVVNLEVLQQIYEVRATPEELTLINEHLKLHPDIPLDKPEQFLHELSEIDDFSERIACLTFQVEFDDEITTIGHALDNFQSICDFLAKSCELKRVLSLVLTLGNYMNGGNVARGQADGFGLDVLPKLRDVKGAQAGITLLHFVVSTYVKNYQEDEKPPPLPVPEPGDIRRAMALDFDSMKGELNLLKNKLHECEKKTEKIINNSTPENLQPFKDKMEAFLEKSHAQLETECESLELCHKLFISTMKLFLFKPKKGTLDTFAPGGFFEYWLPFCVDFKDIYKKEVIRLQVEKAQELKRKEYHDANATKERENGLKAKFKKAKARLRDKETHEKDS